MCLHVVSSSRRTVNLYLIFSLEDVIPWIHPNWTFSRYWENHLSQWLWRRGQNQALLKLCDWEPQNLCQKRMGVFSILIIHLWYACRYDFQERKRGAILLSPEHLSRLHGEIWVFYLVHFEKLSLLFSHWRVLYQRAFGIICIRVPKDPWTCLTNCILASLEQHRVQFQRKCRL